MLYDNIVKETIFLLRATYPGIYNQICKTLFDSHFCEVEEYDKLLTYYARDIIHKGLSMTTLGDMFKDNNTWALKLYCYTDMGRYKLDISFAQILSNLHKDISGKLLVDEIKNDLWRLLP